MAGEGDQQKEGEERRDGEREQQQQEGGGQTGNKDEAEEGLVMVIMVVVAMVELPGVEPGASREEFEEWSNPGLRKQMRETGEEGAEGVLRKGEWQQ